MHTYTRSLSANECDRREWFPASNDGRRLPESFKAYQKCHCYYARNLDAALIDNGNSHGTADAIGWMI